MCGAVQCEYHIRRERFIYLFMYPLVLQFFFCLCPKEEVIIPGFNHLKKIKDVLAMPIQTTAAYSSSLPPWSCSQVREHEMLQLVDRWFFLFHFKFFFGTHTFLILFFKNYKDPTRRGHCRLTEINSPVFERNSHAQGF